MYEIIYRKSLDLQRVEKQVEKAMSSGIDC